MMKSLVFALALALFAVIHCNAAQDARDCKGKDNKCNDKQFCMATGIDPDGNVRHACALKLGKGAACQGRFMSDVHNEMGEIV